MLDGPFGPATQLLSEISLELSRLVELVAEQQATTVEVAAPNVQVLPTPVVVEGKETVIDLGPVIQALQDLKSTPAVDTTPALMAVLAEITAMREQLAQQAEISRRSEEGRSMFGIGASVVTVQNTVPVKNDPDGAPLNVRVQGSAAGATPIVTQKAASATPITLAAADSTRIRLTIANDSTAALYVLEGTGTPSATNYTYKLKQDDTLIVDDFIGALQGVWVSATGFAMVTVIT